MKYYKKINNKFLGFYDSEINHVQLFNNDNLNPDFYEIPESEWLSLLEGQSQGKEIMILKTGELGLYDKPLCDIEGVKLEFNYTTEKWEDVSTTEEKQNFYKQKMIMLNREIKEYVELGLEGDIEYKNLLNELEMAKNQYFSLNKQ